jgi:protein-disulfide isomerase
MKIGVGPVLALVAFTALVTWGVSRPMGAGNALPTAEILARVGGREITRQEVEETRPDQFIQAKQQLHDLTESALTQAIDAKVLDLEAEKQGVSKDELVEREVTDLLPEPTESQIDSVFEVYKDQINQPREVMVPQIRTFLSRQQYGTRLQAFVGELREGYEILNYLEPSRAEVEAIGPAKGPEEAPITLIEFSDFECPFCYRVIPTLDQVRETYGDQVRVVYRQFPLNSIHPHAQITAEASLCADAQGRFWEMHDEIFERRGRVDADELKGMAADLGLDTEAFGACLDSREFQNRVQEDFEAGRKAGVTGTPALFINGRFLNGAQPFAVVSRIIDDELTRVGD